MGGNETEFPRIAEDLLRPVNPEACRVASLHIYGLAKNCSNPIANELGLLQSCTK